MHVAYMHIAPVVLAAYLTRRIYADVRNARFLNILILKMHGK
jgi:hypothetical protein